MTWDKLRQGPIPVEIQTDLTYVEEPAIEEEITRENMPTDFENNSSILTSDEFVVIAPNEDDDDLIEEIDFEEDDICQNAITENITEDKVLQKNTSISPLVENSSLIVTQFLPNPINVHNDSMDSKQPIVTIDYKAVEVPSSTKDILTTFAMDTNNFSKNAIYHCQYCGQSYTNSQYLQTHQRRAHLCQFCTQMFKVTADLREHVRTCHRRHKCAICGKTFNSHGNLRAHQRRVHDLNLPAKVALIDFMENGTGTSNAQLSQSRVHVLESADNINNSTLQSQGPSDQETLNNGGTNIIPLEIVEKEGQLMANLDLSQSSQFLEMFYKSESRNFVPENLLN